MICRNKLLALFSFVFFCLLTKTTISQQSFDQMVKEQLKMTVELFQTDALQELISKNQSFFLLDSREYKEFNVSHIKGAKYVGYKSFSLIVNKSIPKDATVIVYCSIGVRSEEIAEKMKSNGYLHVYNLFGGIFKWVNEGRTVVDAKGNPTNKIHPYSSKWGKWLTKGEKSYD